MKKSSESQQATIDAYKEAGFSCSSTSTPCSNGNNCPAWGAPYLHESHFSGSSAQRDGKGAPCSYGNDVGECDQAPVDGHHRRLCACGTGTSEDGEMENGTKPMKSHSVKVSGTATMVVENAAEFVASPEAKKGCEKAIATKANVKPDQVEVTLSLVESEGRRLSTETVQMEYTITLPADSSSEADSVGAALVETLESIDTTELSAEIVSEVAEATGVTYVATVEALTAEDPVVEETETETVDDSSTTSSTTVTAAVVEKNDNSAGNKQSQVCVLGAALVFWQVFA